MTELDRMKLNRSTMLLGETISLVPYCKHHVEKYHTWMQDKDLQLLTASEPLSLSEEYQMQLSWQTDEDKLTFVAISGNSIPQTVEEEISRMIGDINLFFIFSPDIAEINMMVAENKFRRGGYGTEMLNLMMSYAVDQLNITKFSAKITNSNRPSMSFFQKNTFSLESVCEVFQETNFELPATEVTSFKYRQIVYPFYQPEI